MKQTETIISMPPRGADIEVEEEEVCPEAELRNLSVSTPLHGERVDRALAALVPEFSRSYLQQLLEAGLVLINGQRAPRASQRVKAGDALVVEIRPTEQSQAFKPQSMELNVVYQDAHLVVIDKPMGLVVHPAPGNWSGTLLNGLLAMDPACAQLPRAGIVHRLDKDTSGLMVVARTRASMDALVQAIAARSVRRQYLAVAHAPWSGAAHRSVVAAIGRDPKNRLRMAVVDLAHSQGKPAQTDVELLGNAEKGCFVQCTLHTGRTHQIRVHMASIGHPLVGDAVYGGAAVEAMTRQALHAFRLAFVHPATGESMQFESTPPKDFLTLLAGWSLRYNPPNGRKTP